MSADRGSSEGQSRRMHPFFDQFSRQRGSGQSSRGDRGRGSSRGGGSRGGGSQHGGSSRGGNHSSRGNRRPQLSERRLRLAAVAQETIDALPDILKELPDLKTEESIMYDSIVLSGLDPAKRPKLSAPAKIAVFNADSFEAAIELGGKLQASSGRVAVLNLASHRNPGGGWLRGATAQEEALCYRSSLSRSLHPQYYPWRMNQALYTKDVVIIRSAMDDSHKLLVPPTAPKDLPVVSVISVAAVLNPQKVTGLAPVVPAGSPVPKPREYFARSEDSDITRAKMRLTLRIAAENGHRALVLGALGCGAFHNPVEEVAELWLSVLQEPEFEGWWEHVWFGVYDRNNEGNYEIFHRVLDGKEV